MITKGEAFSITLIITVASIIGKLLGFGRDILISYYYGASSITDAFFLAMSIPMLVIGVFTSSTDSAIIPQYNRIMSLKGRDAADSYFSNIVNSVLIVAFVVSLVILFFPCLFVNIFAPGFNVEQREFSSQFLRFFSFLGFMHILYCFFCAYNAVYIKIMPRAILSFTTNLLAVVALLINADSHMQMLLFAYVAGNMLSGIIPIISAFSSGYKYVAIFFHFDKETQKFIRIFLPIIGVAFLANANLFVDKFLASNMGTGSISYINYASRLTSIFDNVFVVGLGVVILPMLSQYRVNNDFVKFNRNATQVIKLLTIMLLPIMLLCMLLSPQIIEVIYMRGEFRVETVVAVSRVFEGYTPLIWALPMQATLAKIFHSIENTKTPFYINIICVGVNIILSIMLSILWGVKGIAIATSFSVILSVFLLFLKMQKLIGWDSSVFDFKELFKIVICGLVSLIIANITKGFVSHVLLKVLTVGISGAISYCILFALLMKKDFRYLLSFICKK